MIFGIQAPKMIVNIDTTQDEVLLDYAVVLKNEPELDTFEVKSVRTGKRVLTNAGKHWIFQVKIHLWKYADPKAKYLELKSYEGTEVILYRHSDGGPIYDTYNNQGVFILQSLDESITDEKNKFDVLILTFWSKEFIRRSLYSVPPSHIFEPFIGNTFNTLVLQASSQPGTPFSVSGEELLFSGEYYDSGSQYFTNKQFRAIIQSALATDISVSAYLRKTSSYSASTSKAIIGIWNGMGDYAGIGHGTIVNYDNACTIYRLNTGTEVITELSALTIETGRYYKTVFDAFDETVKFYVSADGTIWTYISIISVSGWKDKHFSVGIFAGATNINNNSFAADNLTIDYSPIPE